MSEISKIQWTDATWNVARGCTKVDEDCKFCYMYRESMNNTRYNPLEINRTKTVFNLPLKLKEPSKIFTCSLTDFFHEAIDGYRDEAWDIIRRCPQHTFQILTKRPERIVNHLPADWGQGWDNVWLGASCGSQKALSRASSLLCTQNIKTRFLSLEPLWSKVNLKQQMEYGSGFSFTTNLLTGVTHEWESQAKDGNYDHGKQQGNKIDWVIVGGESGNENGKYRYRPCELQWLESIVDDCKKANIPVFVKQLGTYLAQQMGLSDRHGGNIEEWPEHLRIREFPKKPATWPGN